MKLIDLVTSRSSLPKEKLVLAAVLSSLGGTGILMIVNNAAQEISDNGVDKVDWLLAGLFCLAIVVYALSQFYLVARVGQAVEEAVDNFRMALLERVRRADFRKLEDFGRSKLYESITQSTDTVSQNATFLAMAFQSAILVVVLMGYLAYVSFIAFALVVLTVIFAGYRYFQLGKAMGDGFRQMMEAENAQFESVSDLLDGFKEAKLWRVRSEALGAAYDTLAEKGTRIRIDTQIAAYNQFIFGQVSFYLMLALMVFVVPLYSDSFKNDIMDATMAVMFVIGPIGVVIQSITTLASAEAAAAGMYRLDESLEEMEELTNGLHPFPPPFRDLQMEKLHFAFSAVNGAVDAAPAAGPPPTQSGPPEVDVDVPAEEAQPTEGPPADPEPVDRPFSIGPISMTLRAGEITFLTGGNGSGKTTMLRMLTGLYRADGGILRVNGTPVVADRMADFRELTATVFSEVHLFPRLYGLTPTGRARVEALLPLFEMDTVVSFDGQRFSRTDLSMGQRKRLALITALAEEKPILVLDEWAADQDPHFRRVFYRKILPALKEFGLCVLAVTHDDHYFDACDQRVHMEMGQLSVVKSREDTASGSAGSVGTELGGAG